MTYDGTTPLQSIVAELVGCSLKNQTKIAKITRQAKLALGITSKARILPPEIRVQIYNYLVELYSQDNEPTAHQPENRPQEPVEIISQDSDPETPKPENTNNIPVELYSHIDNFDNVRIAFYTGIGTSRKRQVIALDGFFINALASIGISKEIIPRWLTKQVEGWTAFDDKLPITRQVKYLIMRELIKGLGGNDSVFYANL